MLRLSRGILAAPVVSAAVFIVLAPDLAEADGEHAARAAAPVPTQEVSAGADATRHGWSAYTGTTAALGGGIRHDGWRLRVTAGYGEYSYSSTRWTGSSVITVPFRGHATFADALLGYQQGFGPLTLKVFAGLSAQDHAIAPFDVENPVQGLDWGVKGAIETWLNIGELAFGQLDVSYATANESYGSRLRLGYKVSPQVSTGFEGGLNGNIDYDSGRIGAFVRYEAMWGEVSISGGAAGDRSEAQGAYGTTSLLYRF